MKIRSFVFLIIAFLLSACNETKEEFNKPAIFWYKKIIQNIKSNNLEKADSYYISLKSEHIKSPLLPTTIIMLAHSHSKEEEYLLAGFYLDEYHKQFGKEESREYTEFMKLQASFLGIKDVYKDQKLVIDTIAKAKKYLYRYPDSTYAPMVETIKMRLVMGQYLLNENIASLYDRIGKKDAKKRYIEKNRDFPLKREEIIDPPKGIIGMIFD